MLARRPRGAALIAPLVLSAALAAGCSDREARGAEGSTQLERACEDAARLAISGSPPEVVPGSRFDSGSQPGALREIYDCRAVALDDEDECLLAPRTLQANCRARVRFFHDARREAPHWPGVMADAMHIECAAELPESVCATLRAATRAQAPARCAELPAELRPLCESLATSDPARCADADCRELAGRLRILAEGGGLERLAREGTARDRVTASAALEGLAACEPLIPAFRRQCAGHRGAVD